MQLLMTVGGPRTVRVIEDRRDARHRGEQRQPDRRGREGSAFPGLADGLVNIAHFPYQLCRTVALPAANAWMTATRGTFAEVTREATLHRRATGTRSGGKRRASWRCRW